METVYLLTRLEGIGQESVLSVHKSMLGAVMAKDEAVSKAASTANKAPSMVEYQFDIREKELQE